MSDIYFNVRGQEQFNITFFPKVKTDLPICLKSGNLAVAVEGTSDEEPACQYRRCKRCSFNPWVRKIPWRREMATHSSILAWRIHGQRSLEGYIPWGHKESDTTERLSTAEGY